jgi:hypothetical protein
MLDVLMNACSLSPLAGIEVIDCGLRSLTRLASLADLSPQAGERKQ